jgi:hypothetical protein
MVYESIGFFQDKELVREKDSGKVFIVFYDDCCNCRLVDFEESYIKETEE